MLQRVGVTRQAAAALLSGLMGLAAGTAQAAGVPGADFYIGGSIGHGQVTGADPAQSVDAFKENHTAFKVFTGVRAAMFGAELAYMNFGKATGQIEGQAAEGKLKGVGLFGLFYVPLPVPMLDIYAKAGLARLSRDISSSALNLDTKDTNLGLGAGAQIKFKSFAIRAEYERFSTDGKDPSLLSIGFSKSFL